MHLRTHDYLYNNRSKLLLILVLLGISLLTTGCIAKSGSNAPIDWAAEMHYTQSIKSQEPPRLYSPEGAVPTTGRELIRSKEEYASLKNPVSQTEENAAVGAELYRINRSMCHGSLAQGDGRVGEYLKQYGYIAPHNHTEHATVDKTAAELADILADGSNVMPKFRQLLTEDERWLIINHVRNLQGK